MSGNSGIRRAALGVALGLTMTAYTLAQAPAAKPAAVVNGEAISLAELETVLKQSGPTPVQVPEAARKQIRMQTLGMMIDDMLMRQYLKKQGPQVTAEEVEANLREFTAELEKEKKTLADFLRETGQTEAEMREDVARMTQWNKLTQTRLTEAELQRYYTTYRDFFDGVTVRVSHIVLPTPQSMSPAERAQVKARLDQVRAQILSGQTTFEAAAQAHSQCPSAARGGDLGYIPRRFAVDETFAQVAFSLPANHISDTVQTPFGLHLIRVVDRKAGTPSDFAKVKEAVRGCCIEEMRRGILHQMRQAGKIEVNLE